MSGPPVTSTVLSFEDASRVVEGEVAVGPSHERPIPTFQPAERNPWIWCGLRPACWRSRAAADRDLPPFPRSTRDGYAVRSSDLSKLPGALEVIAEIKAGARLDEIPPSIASGQVASIMTGAPVPDGADAVVMVEYTRPQGARVEVAKGVAPGENIVPRGAEARAGGASARTRPPFE